MTRQGKWNEMAKEVPDDVVHLFAAVGRYDQIVKASRRALRRADRRAERPGQRGATGRLPRDLIQDIRRIPHAFRSFKHAGA